MAQAEGVAAATETDLQDLRRFEAAFKSLLGKLSSHNEANYERHRVQVAGSIAVVIWMVTMAALFVADPFGDKCSAHTWIGKHGVLTGALGIVSLQFGWYAKPASLLDHSTVATRMQQVLRQYQLSCDGSGSLKFVDIIPQGIVPSRS